MQRTSAFRRSQPNQPDPSTKTEELYASKIEANNGVTHVSTSSDFPRSIISAVTAKERAGSAVYPAPLRRQKVAATVSAFREGDTVIVSAFDDVPEHLFLIQSVEEDCVTGIALTGPLEGSYGEPPIELIAGLHEG